MNLQLMGRIRLLEARVVELENQLARYQTPKNSRNSSVPPSKDDSRPKRTRVSVRIRTANPEASQATRAIRWK